jgi:ribose transport system ATP-binding protein
LVASVPTIETSPRQLAELIVGTGATSTAAHVLSHVVDIDAKASILSVQDVSNVFLKHVSFDLGKGEVLGVYGLVGSGRTRLARMLFGLDPIAQGAVLVNGQRVVITSPRAAMRLGIGFLPEDRKRSALIPPMTVEGNTTIASLALLSNRLGWMSPRRERSAFQGVAARFRIRVSSPNLPVRALSGGNQQKVCLGRWLLRRSQILILDEPTRGVDIGAKAEIYAEIRGLAAEGCSLLVLSSEAEEITTLAHRVLVMREGWIRQELRVAPGDEEALLLAAGSGVAAAS